MCQFISSALHAAHEAIKDSVRVAYVWTGTLVAGMTAETLSYILAATFTAYQFGKMLWRDLGRPLCERRGWVKKRSRRKADRPAAGL
ncbi:hypothetical protein N8I74_15715 [Chitiniphilus purpureus]|uniref:Uncharacterized protein n=1 Tax=Chitiniphilus purpureus TaxID=2981137 RepID=A0ABY6DK63_9NEIS|nr:hypothetical protein [Chitiniphilus sp. CD1]UXY14750.1 hypothetical protein N8I74_15715 [Chitiniphilus sp. CD1]